MRDEPDAGLKRRSVRSFGSHEGRRSIQTAGRWSWKSKSAKECVTTHLPNGPAPKMDGAQAHRSHPAVRATRQGLTSRRARGPSRSLGPRGSAERTPARILVVVADIQTRSLKTEAGKGSMRTAVGHGSVDPKRSDRRRSEGARSAGGVRPPAPPPPGGGRRASDRKGIGSRFPNRDRDGRRRERRRERTRRRRRGPRGEFSFLLDGPARTAEVETPDGPGIGSPGDGAGRPAERLGFRGVRDAPVGP